MSSDSVAADLLAWANLVMAPTRTCPSMAAMSDGIVLADLLFEIDPKWFRSVKSSVQLLPTTSSTTGGGSELWALKMSNLKKILKAVHQFMADVLGLDPAPLDIPNLQKIAKDGDEVEMVTLLELIVVVAVHCEQRERFITLITNLPESSQNALMAIIQSIMKRLNDGALESPKHDAEELNQLIEKIHGLELSNRQLQDTVLQLRQENEVFQSQNEELQNEFADLKAKLGDKTQPSAESVLKTEMNRLQDELALSEAKYGELEIRVESQNSTISELYRKLEESEQIAQEKGRLKDQLDEYRHMVDKLQKSEAALEKFKKKAEEGSDVRRQNKVLEEHNAALVDKNSKLEEDNRKLSPLKALTDSYKDQIANLDNKLRELMLERKKFEFEAENTKTKLETVQEERDRAHEKIASLEEHVHELESGAMNVGPALSLSEGLRSAEANQEPNEKLRLLEDQVNQLKTMNETLRLEVDQVDVLKSLLEDTRAAKAKQEQDYLAIYREKLALEAEVKSNDLKQKLEEITLMLAQRERELDTAKADFDNKRQALMAEVSLLRESAQKNDQQKDVTETLNSQIAELQHQVQTLRLESEKSKETMDQQERLNDELKQTLTLSAVTEPADDVEELKGKLKLAAQKMIQFTEQNASLHRALKKAKEHIIAQEQQLKESREAKQDAPFNEALQTLQTSLQSREQDLECVKREYQELQIQTKREQRLILSAWYDLGLQLQRKNNRSPNSPASWLGQQRKAILEGNVKLKK